MIGPFLAPVLCKNGLAIRNATIVIHIVGREIRR